MPVDQILIDAAIELLKRRYPDSGGVAAALYLDDGQILAGVNFDTEWGGGSLCAETGPICTAYTLGRRVAASACVGRLGPGEPIVILSPCGICQERLFHFGPEVEVAVPDRDDPTRWLSKRLDIVQPYYWVNAYRKLGID
jgi:cytidine deaminase